MKKTVGGTLVVGAALLLSLSMPRAAQADDVFNTYVSRGPAPDTTVSQTVDRTPQTSITSGSGALVGGTSTTATAPDVFDQWLRQSPSASVEARYVPQQQPAGLTNHSVGQLDGQNSGPIFPLDQFARGLLR